MTEFRKAAIAVGADPVIVEKVVRLAEKWVGPSLISSHIAKPPQPGVPVTASVREEVPIPKSRVRVSGDYR